VLWRAVSRATNSCRHDASVQAGFGGAAVAVRVRPRPSLSTPVCPARSMPRVSLPGFASRHVSCLFQAMRGEKTREAQPVPVLTDGHSSFSLCLYALLGLGLCRSAPFVKKLHCGCNPGMVPTWRSLPDRSQLRHLAGLLTSTQVFCFIQPDARRNGRFSATIQWGTIDIPLVEITIHTNALASRGPPRVCVERPPGWRYGGDDPGLSFSTRSQGQIVHGHVIKGENYVGEQDC